MRNYKVPKNFKEGNDSAEYYKQTLTFDKRYNGYFLTTSSIIEDYKVLTREEYLNYLSGDFKSIFPEYNKETHYIDSPIYNTTSNLMEQDCIPLYLYKYVEETDAQKLYGCFVFESTSSGTVLKKLNFSSDNYIDLQSKFNLHEDFNTFRANKERYKKSVGRARKGLLFYGPPGNGKTAGISQLSKYAEKEKFRVFFVDKGLSLRDLLQFKDLFENEDSVFVIEEITERASERNAEELLSFLDGELSWNNTYVIATTNHPEELPWNLVDRPSRFKVKLEFPNPNENERLLYLKHMKVKEDLLNETVELTKGMSLDYIKNIVLDSFLEEKTIPEIIKQNKEEHNKVSNKFKNNKLGL